MNGSKNYQKRIVLLLVLLMVLLLGACGGASEQDSPDTGTSSQKSDNNSGEVAATEEAAPVNEPMAEAPADESYFGANSDGTEGEAMGGGAAAAPPPMGTSAPAGVGGGDTAESGSSREEADSSGAVSETVPDQQFQVSLQAGEINDNEAFDEYLQYRLDFMRFIGSRIQVNDVDISERHTIHVTGSDGLPVLGADVVVYAGQELVTSLRTPATGIVYFFPLAYRNASGASTFTVAVQKGRASKEFQISRDANNMTWEVQLDANQGRQNVQLDILFLIDATGSMSPQIEQLKDNILSISAQIEALPGDPDVQYGMVAYRDRGDTYVTNTYNFTGDINQFQRDLSGINAGGGGDTPEAMNEGLHEAINGVQWRGENTISIIILVADAPPHLDYTQDYDYSQEMQTAAGMGIKIFPIMADTGVEGDDRNQAEYVLRQIAHFTGGSFIFVTSKDTPKSTGEEGTDLGVQEDAYSVENLDALVVRLIREEIEALFGSGQ